MKKENSRLYDRILSLLLTMLGFGIAGDFTSCISAEYGPDPNYYDLEVDPTSLEFEHYAGETKKVKVIIKGNDKGWWIISHTGIDGFFTVTPTKGDRSDIIYITTIKDNNSSYEYEGMISIEGEYSDSKCHVILKQKGKPSQ